MLAALHGMEQQSIDLNCDMGEMADGESDSAIMPHISSANIACGGHAGDLRSMQRTVALALKHKVAIGAHPSFPDREGFGRRDMKLTAAQLWASILEQIRALAAVVKAQGGVLHHVKLHGALYNMAARDAAMARTTAQAVGDFDPSLIVYGLSGSPMISEAKALGLRTASEAFADRTYRPDGSLTPRSEAHAMIQDPATSVAQVLQMIRSGTVDANGSTAKIFAETICIHGDEPEAPQFARRIAEAIRANGIVIQAPA